VADDLGVDLEQVHPAHPRLAGQPGGDHADVGPGRLLVGVAAHDPGLEALDGPALHHVEGQALGLVLDDVDHHDLVDDVGLGDALCGGGAVETGSDDRDLHGGSWTVLDGRRGVDFIAARAELLYRSRSSTRRASPSSTILSAAPPWAAPWSGWASRTRRRNRRRTSSRSSDVSGAKPMTSMAQRRSAGTPHQRSAARPLPGAAAAAGRDV